MLFLPIVEPQPPARCVFKVEEMMQRVAAFLLAVRDPLNPSCCPYCFAVLVFDLGHNAAALDALQRDAYDFWEKCITLIIDYTKADIPRLRTRLRQNQMACKERSTYHKMCFSLVTSDTFDIFLNALLFTVATGLYEGKRPAYTQGRVAKFHNRKGYWPRNFDDLFPMEVDRVLDGILHWVCAPSSPYPLSLLNTYLVTARAVVFPVLMEQPRRDRMAWALLQHITPELPTVPWHGAAPCTVPAGLSVPRLVRHDVMLCDMALFTLRIVRNDMHARTDDDALFLAGHEALFLDALERLDVLENMDAAQPVPSPMPYSSGNRRAVLTLRARAIGEYRCMLRALLGMEHGTCAPAAHDVSSPARVVHHFLIRRMNATYCFNPNCTRAELDKYQTMRPFQKCAQCHFARYCSRACQKEDWSKNEPKHKELCGQIATLGRMVENDATTADFAAKFAQTDEFTPENVAMLVRWAMACRLLPRCRFVGAA